MLAVIQRVLDSTVVSDGVKTGEIGRGLVVYLGVFNGDTSADASLLVKKISKLRIFSDENDKLNLSLGDINGEIMVISNFTLCGKMKTSGNRPSYIDAMRPEEATVLYNEFIELMTSEGFKPQCGVFGADMKVSCTIDGPVNLIIDTRTLSK